MRTSLSLLGLIFVLLIAGCSGQDPNLVKVSGQLLYHKKPFPDPKGSVIITLNPVVEGDKSFSTYPALYKRDDSTFTVPGPKGHGVPLGKYRISVNIVTLNPTEMTNSINQTFTPADSPLVRDVTGEANLELDLGTPN